MLLRVFTYIRRAVITYLSQWMFASTVGRRGSIVGLTGLRAEPKAQTPRKAILCAELISANLFLCRIS